MVAVKADIGARKIYNIAQRKLLKSGGLRLNAKVRCRGTHSGLTASTVGSIIFIGQFFVTVFNGVYNESFFYEQIEEVLG